MSRRPLPGRFLGAGGREANAGGGVRARGERVVGGCPDLMVAVGGWLEHAAVGACSVGIAAAVVDHAIGGGVAPRGEDVGRRRGCDIEGVLGNGTGLRPRKSVRPQT